MKEDAVAPVVAAMLLLAVVVTLFAAWNAYYVPSMKAQSEITHIRDVESGFLKFSSDIETAASLKKSMRLSEPVPLGGGEFTFDSVKSGGLLRIRGVPEEYLSTTILNGTDTMTSTSNVTVFSNYSYEPVNNFWQDQGYAWSYGNVNVTKGRLSTPLLDYRMDDVAYGVTGVLFDLDARPFPEDPAKCSLVTLYTVNITSDTGHTSASGNGNGRLVLNSTVTSQQLSNVTILNISVSNRQDIPVRFQDAMWESVNRQINEYLLSCPNVHVSYPQNPGVRGEVGIEFDRVPNATLIRKTTEIMLAAY
jgi:hypothetical protein